MNIDVSHKRKLTNDFHPLIKRNKKDDWSLEKLPLDIMGVICHSLQLHELAALTRTSKRWVEMTAQMPFWRNLCSQAGLQLNEKTSAREVFVQKLAVNDTRALLTSIRYFSESKNISKTVNILRLLRECHAALRHRELLSSAEQLEIKDRIKYLQAWQATKKEPGALLNDRELRDCLHTLGGSAFSATLAAHAQIMIIYLVLQRRSNQLNMPQAFLAADTVSQNELASEWIRAEARLLMAKIASRTDQLSHHEIAKLYLGVSQNEQARERIKMRANEELADMFFAGQTEQVMTCEQGLALLQGICRNPQSAPALKTKALYMLAFMREKLNRCDLLTNEDTALFLQAYLHQTDLGSLAACRDEGEFLLVKMHLENRAHVLSQAQIESYLHSASLSSSLTSQQKAFAQCELAKMRCHGYTHVISDETAIIWLQQSVQHLCNPKDKNEILFYMAEMQASDRAKSLSDQQAASCLQAASQDPSLALAIKARAELWLAVMHVQGRTNKLTDKQAYELLYRLCQNPILNKSGRTQAHLYLAAIQVNNPHLGLSDQLATTVLLGLHTDVSATFEQKQLAGFLLARLCIENRTQLINMHDALHMLNGIIQNSMTKEELRQAAINLRYQAY